jgi:hypothetical protein
MLSGISIWLSWRILLNGTPILVAKQTRLSMPKKMLARCNFTQFPNKLLHNGTGEPLLFPAMRD